MNRAIYMRDVLIETVKLFAAGASIVAGFILMVVIAGGC